MSESNVIKAGSAEQEFQAAAAVAALKDAGIAADYRQASEGGALGLPGAYGMPEAFDIFVSEQDAEKAGVILSALGCAADEDSGEDTADNSESTVAAAQSQEKQPQTLAELFPENRWLAAIYKVLFGIIIIAFLIFFVWLCDTAIAWVISLFSA